MILYNSKLNWICVKILEHCEVQKQSIMQIDAIMYLNMLKLVSTLVKMLNNFEEFPYNLHV